MVSALIWRGVGLQDKRGFQGTRLTVGASNDLQMERNLTGGLPVIYQGHSTNLNPFRERFSTAYETRSERGDGRMRECLCSARTTERTGGTRTDASFEKHADDDMEKCNTQANDMATTANNWKTPGTSDSGRYSTALYSTPKKRTLPLVKRRLPPSSVARMKKSRNLSRSGPRS